MRAECSGLPVKPRGCPSWLGSRPRKKEKKKQASSRTGVLCPLSWLSGCHCPLRGPTARPRDPTVHPRRPTAHPGVPLPTPAVPLPVPWVPVPTPGVPLPTLRTCCPRPGSHCPPRGPAAHPHSPLGLSFPSFPARPGPPKRDRGFVEDAMSGIRPKKRRKPCSPRDFQGKECPERVMMLDGLFGFVTNTSRKFKNSS